MAITSLGFNIFSTYNGSGLGRARRDINNTSGSLGGLDKQTKANTRSMNSFTRGLRVASSRLVQNSRAARVVSATHRVLARRIGEATSSLKGHNRMARLTAGAHRILSRVTRASSISLGRHSRAARLASTSVGALGRMARSASSALLGHTRATRLASTASAAFGRMARRAAVGVSLLGRGARAAGNGLAFMGRWVRSTSSSLVSHARNSRVAAAGHRALAAGARGAGRAMAVMSTFARNASVRIRAVGNNTRSATGHNKAIALMGRAFGAMGGAASGAVSGIGGVASAVAQVGGGLGGVVLVGFAIKMLGPIAAVASALMLAVLPIPFIALGAFAVRNVAKVKNAFHSMSASVGASIRRAAQPLIPFLVRGMQQVARVAKALEGPLRRAFAAAGPSLSGLINMVNRFVRGALPGLTAAMRNLGPKFWGPMARGFGAIGKAIGDFFRIISMGSGPAAKAFLAFAIGVRAFIRDWAKLFLMLMKDSSTIQMIKTAFAILHATMNALRFVIVWNIVFWKIIGAVIHAVGNVIAFIVGWWRVLIHVMGVVWRATVSGLVVVWRAVSAGLKVAWFAVWRAMSFVARAIWTGMRIVWRATVFAFLIIWRVVSAGLRVVWNAVWRAMSIVGRAIWAGMKAAWRGTVFAFIIIWRAVSAGLRVAWNAVWRVMVIVGRAVWAAMKAGWSATAGFIVRVMRAMGAGVLFAWRALWRIAKIVGLAVWRFMRAAWAAMASFFVRVGRAMGAAILFAWRALWRIAKVVGLAVWRFMRAAWNALKNFFIRVARILGAGVLFAWRALWRIAKIVGLAVWRFMRAAWAAVKNFFIRVARILGMGVLIAWRALWRIVKIVGLAAWRFLRAAWNAMKNFFIRVARVLWNGIRALFAAGSRWLRTTFWNPVRNFFTKTIPNAFRAAVRSIAKAWNALKHAVSAPVKAVVDVVYNKGIRGVWNMVAGAFGAKKLGSFKFKGFQEGGYTGNGPASQVAGVVHKGEYVIPADQYKKMNGKSKTHGMNGAGFGPQVLQGLSDGTFSDASNSMRGLGTRGAASGNIPKQYKAEFGKPVRGSGGGPIDDGFDPGGFFSGIGDFFKKIGGGVANAFHAATGFGAKVLKQLATLALCSIAPIANPLIQKAADIGKGVVNGAIPGTPMLQKLFSGSRKSSKKTEGNIQGMGMIQMAADAIKDWITANDICDGCGFTEFRPWRAGDGKREGNLDHRTRLMLNMARKNGFKGSVTQGSWSHAGASAGTHAGGGAMDTSPPSNKNVGALRSAGFAAWNRGAKWGSASFAPHTHSIAVGNHNLSPAAAQQVRDFKAGKNGLAGGGKDNFKDSSCSGKAGNCNSYRGMAAKALSANGLGGARNLAKFMTQMKKESGCNPKARNGWDSNAKAGNASVGLMQVIPSTFRANHCPGTSGNIYDPYANICASARYQKRRYGTVNGTPYARGVAHATAGWHLVGERGPEMVRFNGGESVESASQTRRMAGGVDGVERHEGGSGDIHVHIHGTVYAKSEMEFERMLSGALQNLKRKRKLPK